MRRPLIRIWTPIAIVVPLASGIAWLCFHHVLPGVVGIATAAINATLLVRSRMPLRIPSFVPPKRRKPVVVPNLRYPGNG